MLTGLGMFIQICPAMAETKPIIAHADHELEDLRKQLIADGESPHFAELIASTLPHLRKQGRFAATAVQFGHASGAKYEFIDSNSRVVHYALRVPGGYVTVMATSPIGKLDAQVVESVLHSIAIT